MLCVRQCCCFDLKMGGTILAWIGIIGSILSLNCIPLLINLNLIPKIAQYFANSPHIPGNITRNWESFLQLFMRIAVIYYLLNLLSAFLLLFAIKRENPKKIVPWLLINLVSVGLVALLFVYITLDMITSKGLFLDWLAFGGSLVLRVYFWCCIFSLYHLIKEEKFLTDNSYNGTELPLYARAPYIKNKTASSPVNPSIV